MDLIANLSQLIPSIGHRGNPAGLVTGIGDDAAVLRPSPSSEWIVSCDFSLEGVHFRTDYPPESVGYKSLARATSDLAAMGARPRYFLLALALPASKTSKWFRRFASGMSRAANEFDSRLIGGDISQSASVTISITVLGEITPGSAVTRSEAKPGDLIYVTGTLGAAQLGFEIVRRGLSRQPSLRRYLRPHFYPNIPAGLGQRLARLRIPAAMMDLSDGLSTDLARLCAASRVGAKIWTNKIPCVRVPNLWSLRALKSLDLALHGGEDYGLLFTVPAKSAQRHRHIARGVQVTHIGEITRQRSILLLHSDGRASTLPARGWNPFRTGTKQ
jgi:thiamine-monophosphate kinase